MAKAFSTLFSHISGKFGDIEVCQTRNGMYIRRHTPHRSKPPTPAQLMQRRRLNAAVLLYRAASEQSLHLIWKRSKCAKGMTGFNRFVQANIHNFTQGGLIVDYAKVQLSTGHLDLPDCLLATFEDEDAVRLCWEQSQEPFRGKPDDRLVAFAMEEGESYGMVPADTGGACRRDGQATVRLEGGRRRPCHLYLFFAAADNAGFSPNRHVKMGGTGKMYL